VLIIAAGGIHDVPKVSGIDGRNVLTSRDLHRKLKTYLKFFGPRLLSWLTKIWMPLGKRVVIMGGGIHGCQTAAFLVKRGRRVTIVETGKEIGDGLLEVLVKPHLLMWFDDKGVSMKAKVKYDPADLGCIYVYDPKAEAYVEVECLNKDYAQGLSLWKHRVICNLARQESNNVDLLALARAKRKIQQIVQESRSSKRIKSRSRVARWETGGNAAGQTSQGTTPDPGQAPPLLPEPQSDLSSSAPELVIDLEDLEREGWSAGYDLPNTHR